MVSLPFSLSCQRLYHSGNVSSCLAILLSVTSLPSSHLLILSCTCRSVGVTPVSTLMASCHTVLDPFATFSSTLLCTSSSLLFDSTFLNSFPQNSQRTLVLQGTVSPRIIVQAETTAQPVGVQPLLWWRVRETGGGGVPGSVAGIWKCPASSAGVQPKTILWFNVLIE